MLLDLVIRDYIYPPGKKCDESDGLWCVCAVPTPAGMRGQTMEWTAAVPSWGTVVGGVHRVIGQTELKRLDGLRTAALSAGSACACFREDTGSSIGFSYSGMWPGGSNV